MENLLRLGKKPADIPSKPDYTYAETGWSSWGDWLGTGRIADQLREYWPFNKARAFVRGLGLKSQAEWHGYCASGQKPVEISSNPSHTFAGKGWAGFGDWLGTGTVALHLREYRPFRKARVFARSLGLKSVTEWGKYCSSSEKPTDIPNNPDYLYAETGWSGWGDWLGTGRLRGSGWRTFNDARAFVRRLGLKSRDEWEEYCKSGKKPSDIPAAPWEKYADAGWSGMGDWLGTGTVAPRLRQYRPFEKARTFVQRLGLKSRAEWGEYCKSGRKPADIPANPHGVYAEDGWAGMGDWLGTGTVAPYLRKYRSFDEARAYARRLSLKSETEWRSYCKSGQKPADIPGSPEDQYAKTGWAGFGDWLGTGAVPNRLRQYRSFKKARTFVRSLNLKSRDEWDEFCNSGKKPADIPAAPWGTYADAGWTGLGDWLGTDRLRGKAWRSFKDARA